MPDRFETEVLPDGSKRFLFEVNLGPGSRSSRDDNRPLGPTQIENSLDSYFEQYPFCDEGYFLYDRGFNGSAYTIRGECQESAEIPDN